MRLSYIYIIKQRILKEIEILKLKNIYLYWRFDKSIINYFINNRKKSILD